MAHQPSDLVWVFCRYVPQKGSPKLMRAWRGSHKIVQVFQDGRVYVLDTGQKLHFERLKSYQSGPLEFATAQTDGGDIEVLMDPEPEHSIDAIDDNMSQPSFVTEQLLSDASDLPLPSRGRHWMNTRSRSKLRAGGSRMHYQQFAYFTSGTDDELSGVMLSILPMHFDVPPAEPEAPTPSSDQSVSPRRDLPHLFSDHEHARSPSPHLTASEKESSLLGTSAPLLTNPSLTDFHSNYPIWPTATHPDPLSTDGDDPSPAPTIPSALPERGPLLLSKGRRGDHPN